MVKERLTSMGIVRLASVRIVSTVLPSSRQPGCQGLVAIMHEALMHAHNLSVHGRLILPAFLSAACSASDLSPYESWLCYRAHLHLVVHVRHSCIMGGIYIKSSPVPPSKMTPPGKDSSSCYSTPMIMYVHHAMCWCSSCWRSLGSLQRRQCYCWSPGVPPKPSPPSFSPRLGLEKELQCVAAVRSSRESLQLQAPSKRKDWSAPFCSIPGTFIYLYVLLVCFPN